MKAKRILVTNDDGFDSKGIKELYHLMSNFGEVIVVAPSGAQSGKSSAISLSTNLYLNEEYSGHNLRVYSFNGTPVDCVKLGINEFFKDELPDLLVSGINHGTNSSIASIYSGTLGACVEGTIYGIPSIGFSLDSHDQDPDFSGAIHYCRIIIEKFLKNPFGKSVYLNVNLPCTTLDKIKGIRVAKRGKGIWLDEFTKIVDGNGNTSFRMEGYFKNLESKNEIEPGDHILLHQGYVTIVPHNFNNTDYLEIKNLRQKWELE